MDVLVLGGGPAGLATAIELRRLGMTVVIAEATYLQSQKLGETLSSKAICLLERLRLADVFRLHGHLPAQAIRSSWGSSELMDRPALFDPYGPFWHLDRRQFDLMLLNHAKHRGVNVLLGTRLIHSDWCGKQWQARLRSANHEFTLRARFLVDATGRAGFLAGRLSRRTDRIDRLVGISKRFSGQDCRGEPWTLVEAIGDGWWYSSPLPSGETLAVFMTDADLIQGLHDQDRAWNSWLVKSEYTQKRLRGLETGSMWKVQSAQSCFNHSNSEDHWLAVGDAAIACDPLAGRGLTMSLETGIAAAYAIAEFRKGRTDPADRYRRALIESWEVYCRQLTETYRLERRWPNSPFWLRRHCTDYPDRSPAELANARDSSSIRPTHL